MTVTKKWYFKYVKVSIDMEFSMDIICQVIAGIIVVLFEKYIDRSIENSFDKEKYCLAYLDSLNSNNQSAEQINSVNSNLLNNSVQNVHQENYIHQEIYNISSNSNERHLLNELDFFQVLALFIAFMAVTVACFGLLKFYFYLDFWFPFLILIAICIDTIIFKSNYNKNASLYFQKNIHLSSLILIYGFFMMFTLYVKDDTVELFLSSLQSIPFAGDGILSCFTYIGDCSQLLFHLQPLQMLKILLYLMLYILPLFLVTFEIKYQHYQKRTCLSVDFVICCFLLLFLAFKLI